MTTSPFSSLTPESCQRDLEAVAGLVALLKAQAHSPANGQFVSTGGGGASGLSDSERLEGDYARWSQALSPAEQQAVHDYTRSMHRGVNAALRTGNNPGGHVAQVIEGVKSALSSARAPRALTVHRGLENKGGKRWDFFQQHVGQTFTDKGFVSTSVDEHRAHGFSGWGGEGVVAHISVPKGFHGAYVAGLSKARAEKEFLLQHDSQFKIERAYVDSAGRKHLELTVLLPGEFKAQAHSPTNGQFISSSGGSGGGEALTAQHKHLTEAMYQSWGKTLSDAQLTAINQYRDSKTFYKNANTALRAGKDKLRSAYWTETLSQLRSALSTARTPHALTVQRGLINTGGARLAFFQAHVGQRFIDKGLCSTTLSDHTLKTFLPAEEALALHISVPAGSHAAYLPGTHTSATWGEEYELLLAPGTQFKVLRTSTDASGRSHVELEVVVGAPAGKAQVHSPQNGQFVPGGGDAAAGATSFASLPINQQHQALKVAYGSWYNTLGSKQVDALQAYLGNGYTAINSGLRSGKPPAAMLPVIKTVSTALGKGRTPFAMTVYRGLADQHGALLALFQQHTGQTFTDHGFVSTSITTSGKGAGDFLHPEGEGATYTGGSVMMHIHVPKSSCAAYVEPYATDNPGEYELLLPAGSQFRIDGVGTKDGVPLVEATYLGPAKATKEAGFEDDLGSVVALLAELKAQAHDPHNGQFVGDGGGSSGDAFPTTHSMDISSAFGDWYKGVTPVENTYIKKYTSNAYSEFNTALRTGATHDEELMRQVKIVQRALLKGSAPHNLTVFRALKDSNNSRMGFLSTHVGETFTDKGFASTTTNSNTSDMFAGNTILHIQIPKGAPGAYIAHISVTPTESEYLLPHGSQFKIERAYVDPHDNLNHVVVSYVQGADNAPAKQRGYTRDLAEVDQLMSQLKAQVHGAGGRFVSGGGGGDAIVRADVSKIEQGAAYQRAAHDTAYLNTMNEPGKGDLFLHDLAHELGFDAKPQLVSKTQMDGCIAAGERELMRGVTSEQFARQFQTGNLFAGRGVFGNGTYAGHGKELHLAKQYAGIEGVVMRMSLKKGAKVGAYSDLVAVRNEEYKTMALDAFAAHNAGNKEQAALLMAGFALYHDIGRYAMIRGYDAIDVGDPAYTIILNRSVVRVQKEFV